MFRVLNAFTRYLVLATSLISTCHGQNRWDMLDFKTASVGGFRLYGVSVSSGYTNFAGPVNTDQLVPVRANLGADLSYGAQGAAGWRNQGGKNSISVVYSGSYFGRRQYTDLNAFGHALNLSFSRKVRSKWAVSLTAAADIRTFAQYLFQPQPVSVLSQLPGSAGDLAAAYSIGAFSSDQAAATLSGSQLMATSGVADLIMANRVLFYQGQASASYAHSSRLSLNFSSFSAGGQQSFGGKQALPMPRSIGAMAGMSLSYALNPRSVIGFNVNESIMQTQFQRGYSTNGSASFGRKMGVHWFLNLSAGMSYSQVKATGYSAPPSRQVIGSGSIGYRTRAHTFLGSYNRSSQDVFGTAAGLNSVASGAWNWLRPGSPWTVFSGFGYHQIRNAGFASLTGWRTSVGISRTLSNQFSVNCEYAYLNSTGTYLGSFYKRNVQTAQLSFRWHPQGVRRPQGNPESDINQYDPDR
jgi:hypothetical protein